MKHLFTAFLFLIFSAAAIHSQQNPHLSAPMNNSTWETTTPVLYWWMIGSSSTTVYTVLISNSETNFANPSFLYSSTVTGVTSFQVPANANLITGMKYYWKVNSGGHSSEVWDFTTTGTIMKPEFTELGLKKSADQSSWSSISGNFTTGFTTELFMLSNPNAFYYLDIDAEPKTNIPLEQGYYGFTLSGHPEELDNYFAAKGVTSAASSGTWQEVVYRIINGSLPTFYIHVASDGTMSLVDGMLHYLYPESAPEYNGRLRINPDYPAGTYTYTGSIEGINGEISSPITVSLTLTGTAPGFTSLTLKKTSDQVHWTSITGNINEGFSTELIALSNPSDFYYLNIAEGAAVNTPLAEGNYGFKVTTHPIELDSYFAAKGVTSDASAGTWQEIVYRIINGNLPTFYIHVASDGTMSLVDGLLHEMGSDGLLRINPDYPLGTYIYSGTIIGKNNHSSALNVSLSIERNKPRLLNFRVDEITRMGQIINQDSTHITVECYNIGNQLALTSSGITINTPLAKTDTVYGIPMSFYGFKLISHPPEWDNYWAGKGITAAWGTFPENSYPYKMYHMIHGDLPYFYITENSGYVNFIDEGLFAQYGQRYYYINLHQDYPIGTYVFSGTLVGENGLTSDTITISITIEKLVPAFTNLELQKSYDQTTWRTVSGNLNAGFTTALTPVEGGFYYLNFGPETVINTPFTWGFYPFYLTGHPAGLDAYFAAKGVHASADPASWQGVLYRIITGELPTFYIHSSGTNKILRLVDGLQHLIYPGTDPAYFALLRINDDYPEGTYSYSGAVSAFNGLTSPPINVHLTITHPEIHLPDKVLTIGSAASNKGATVCIPVSITLSEENSISSFLLGKFTYDMTKLRFKYVTAGSGTLLSENGWSLSGYKLSENQFGFTSLGYSEINTSGVLFNVYFDVIGETAGTASITSSPQDWNIDTGNSLAYIIPGTVTYTIPAGTSNLRGDATLDFTVDENDANAIINQAYNISDPLTGQALANADATRDGVIDISDAIAVYYYLAFGSWSFNLTPSSSSFISFENADAQKNLIRIPVSIYDAEKVNSLDIKFIYDSNILGYQSFKAEELNNKTFTLASEVKPGEAHFTYINVGEGSSTRKTGEIVLNFKDEKLLSGLSLKTEYSINGSQFKAGPVLRLGTTGIEEASVIPEKFIVCQNYPNPFNPSTTIQYALPEDVHVNVSIYNTIGQEIKTLINTDQNAGIYTIEWKGDDNSGNKVTSGLYIYKVTAGSNVSSKKMMLLK